MSRVLPLALALSLLVSGTCQAGVTVFLDFTTDLQDGAGGDSNGIADWIDELNQATTSAGVSAFSSSDRSTIQANIKSQLESIYGAYNATFVTTAPGSGSFDEIYFGEDTSAGVLGFAPLDYGNLFSGQVASVGTGQFGFIIDDSGISVATQITQLGTALAGTAAHEWGHTLGLHHHHAYSDPGITPATYSSTGGLQNSYVMATGSTGLDEAGRETLRGFSPFEKVMLDITGGAALTFVGQNNESVVTGGIVSNRTENGSSSSLGTDAGDTLATAQALSFATGPTSGLDISFIEADLDSASGDIDMFSFAVLSPANLLAHVYSNDLRYSTSAKFDPKLELLNSIGDVIASNGNVAYSGNTYGSGGSGVLDSFLNNIPLASAGTYYLRVTAESGAELGSNYWMVTAFDGSAVPEPGSFVLALVAAAAYGRVRWRRRKSANAETT